MELRSKSLGNGRLSLVGLDVPVQSSYLAAMVLSLERPPSPFEVIAEADASAF
jgi:hypothetical protein